MSTPSEASPPTVVSSMVRHKALAASIALIGAALGAAYSLSQPIRPVATALLVVHDPRNDNQGFDGGSAARYVADQAVLMKSYSVGVLASNRLARQHPPVHLSPEAVLERLTVTTTASSNALTLRFKAPSERLARVGASAVIAAYSEKVADELHAAIAGQLRTIDQALSELPTTNGAGRVSASDQLAVNQLLAQRTSLVVLNADPTPGVSASSPPHATTPSRLSSLVRETGLGLFLGLLAAAVLCYLKASRLRRLVDRSDGVEMLGVPLLATLKASGRADSNGHTDTVSAAAALIARQSETESRVIAVIAVGRANAVFAAETIAAGYAQLGRRASLVDTTAGDVDVDELAPRVRGARGADPDAEVDAVIVAVDGVDAVVGTKGLLGHVDAAVLVVRRGARAADVVEAGDRVLLYGLQLLGFLYLTGHGTIAQRAGDRRVVARAGATHPSLP